VGRVPGGLSLGRDMTMGKKNEKHAVYQWRRMDKGEYRKANQNKEGGGKIESDGLGRVPKREKAYTGARGGREKKGVEPAGGAERGRRCASGGASHFTWGPILDERGEWGQERSWKNEKE